MWFRLKKDYETQKDEIHLDSWKIRKIKKGAAITVVPFFDLKMKLRPGFSFSCGTLKHMDISMLDLPKICEKNFLGDVYCATKKEFFYASFNSSGQTIGKQLIHCPLCGKKLKEQAEFPRDEKTESFEEK